MTGPEPDDIIGTEDPRASFEDFAEAASERLTAAATELAGTEGTDLLAGVLERASRRWWWISRAGRDPEREVLRMLVRASGRDAADLERVTALAGRPREPGAGPGPDLLAAVRHRHARHVRRRTVACGVAAVVVLAAVAWPVTNALRGGPRPPESRLAATASRSPLISAQQGLGSVPGPSPDYGPHVPRAAGTVLRDCQDNNNGQLSRHWRAQSVRAGPVWFVFARSPGYWSLSNPLPHGRLDGRAGVIAIRAGQRAVVRVTGPARARFHFLPGFASSNSYTLRGGLPGLTLGSCPATFTMFWQGYISTVSCVPLVVTSLPHGRPVHVTVSAYRGACRAR